MPRTRGVFDRLAAGALLFALWLGAGLVPPAARGESPPAFDERGILAAGVAPSSHTGGILSRRALPARRLARLGATPDFRHGLLATAPPSRAVQGDDGDADGGLGPPPLYEELGEARVVHAGQIRDGRMQLDRFEFELTDGHLYLAPEIGGVVSTAVFLGDGLVRAYPPDAVEHHQLEKLSDEHHLEAEFDRLLLRFTDDTADRLKALATPAPERDTGKGQRSPGRPAGGSGSSSSSTTPDSRVLEDLLRRQAGTLPAGRTYALLEIDSKDEGWLTIEVEPNEIEEVVLSRYVQRRRGLDTWDALRHPERPRPGPSRYGAQRFRRGPGLARR